MNWLTSRLFSRPKQPGRSARRARKVHLLLESLESRLTPTINVTFDFTTLGAAANGFDAAAQQAMDAAGHALGDHLTNPAAVEIKGGTMAYSDFDPATGLSRTDQTIQLNGAANSDIPANELYVVVEVSDLSKLRPAGSTGAQGRFSALDPGAISHGGAIQVDLNYLTSLGDGPGTANFQTLMEHELGHVLGFGQSDAWNNLAVGSDPTTHNPQTFIGPSAEAEYGREATPANPVDTPVPLDVKVQGHWAPVGTLAQPAAMQEINTIGFTPLDFSALQDIGWTWDGQGAVLPATIASARELTVTSSLDPSALTPWTLRYAIQQANADSAIGISDSIFFDIAQMSSDTITLTQGDFELKAGSGTTTINGLGQVALKGYAFQVDSGANVVLKGLTIENGESDYPPASGISNAGTLLVSNCTLSSNGYDWAVLYNTGTMTVSNSSISNNATSGIGNTGTMTVSNCTVSGNSYGGITNTGTMTVSSSTISNNSLGGFENWYSGAMTVTNSTISGNNAVDGGGFSNLGTLTVSNSTVCNNSAHFAPGILSPASSGGRLTLVNTIVAGNSSATGASDDLSGLSGDSAHNFIADRSPILGGGISNGVNGNRIGVDPKLASPGNNGGPTQTVALRTGSPAIGAGGGVTSLAAGVNSATATTLSVANAAAIASTPGSYPILIDGEEMLVTNVDLTANTLTVVRGYNGTTAVSHSSAAQVFLATDQRGFSRPLTPDVGAYQTPFSLPVVLHADGSLFLGTGPGTLLSPAGTILAASTALDGAGRQDVFAITAAGRNLWEHTPAGWALLSTGSFAQVSAASTAASDAVVFAVLADNSLWEHSSLFPGGWRMLSPGGTILSISAVTDAAGNDDVFAITADRHLWEHTPSGWAMLSVGSFGQISAGLNGAGQAVLYGVLTDNSLWEYNPAFNIGVNLRLLSPAGTILSASAAGPDQVFAITADGHLWQHNPSGWSLTSTGSFASLSGEDNGGKGEVFAVLQDGSLWEYTTSWAELEAAGVLAVAASKRR
jgi:hypothetical protein